MKIIYLLITCLFSSLMLIAQDFEVAPVVLNFTANPSEIQVKKLTIKNHSPQKQKFELKYADYELGKDGKRIPVELGKTKHTCMDWISINPTIFELNPNEAIDADVIMTVPQSGDDTRFGVIQVQVAKEQSAMEADKVLATGVLVVPRIVVMVSQTPKNSSNYKGEIKDLKEITLPNDTIRKFTVNVANTGGNIIKGKAYLAVANILSADEKKYEPVEITVYPGASKQYTLKIPEKLPKGKYVVAAILDYGHRKPLEGTQIMIDQK